MWKYKRLVPTYPQFIHKLWINLCKLTKNTLTGLWTMFIMKAAKRNYG